MLGLTLGLCPGELAADGRRLRVPVRNWATERFSSLRKWPTNWDPLTHETRRATHCDCLHTHTWRHTHKPTSGQHSSDNNRRLRNWRSLSVCLSAFRRPARTN